MDSCKVAFTAKLNTSDSYPSHRGVLKFHNVLVNEGDGYRPGTGIFTCPRSGFYHFAVHMSVYGTAQVAIYKNGAVVVSMYNNSERKSEVASISSVVKLSQGDEVWVNLWGPGRNDIYTSKDSDSVFVGFCLW